MNISALALYLLGALLVDEVVQPEHSNPRREGPVLVNLIIVGSLAIHGCLLDGRPRFVSVATSVVMGMAMRAIIADATSFAAALGAVPVVLALHRARVGTHQVRPSAHPTRCAAGGGGSRRCIDEPAFEDIDVDGIR